MNTQVTTTQIKHLFRENMFKANAIVQKNWFKLVIAVLLAFIILRKDLNIQLNLVNSPKGIQNEYAPISVSEGEGARAEKMSYTAPVAESAKRSIKENMATKIAAKASPKKEKKAPAAEENLANTFSNIGFILNPTYAKRNNVSPAIVAEKRKICDAYVKEHAAFAVEEMRKYGIPASITLAQGLLESNAGDSKLARLNNNHFGIKCFEKQCRPEHCSNYTDDTHKDFFRKYTDVKESYRAHSLFLQRSRYTHLSPLGTKNYKDWAHGLRKAGYATDKKYAPKLITLIETLKLNKFDE